MVSDDGVPSRTRMVQVDDDMNGHLALDSTVEALTKLMNLWNKRTRSHVAFGKKDIGDLK